MIFKLRTSDKRFDIIKSMRIFWLQGVLFLAHLSWKLKWTFLIACRPSSVCQSVRLSLNFSYFRLLLRNHCANFNQTWHKVSLGKGDSSLLKWRAITFPTGRYLQNSEITLTTLKNLLLKNRWANFNQTWHKSSFGKGDSSLFKWRDPSYSKGR